MYTWKDLCPLTSEEATRALGHGLLILALQGGKSQVVKTKAGILFHAKRGAVFATDRRALEMKETHYEADYVILRNDTDGVVSASKLYKTRDEAKDDCKAFLAQTMREHGILEDGRYDAHYELYRYTFGNFAGLDEDDEGEVVLESGVVTDVPAGFWLPF